MLRSFFSVFLHDLAIDLGTANTFVYHQDKGIIVNEPSVVAVSSADEIEDREVLAIGNKAKEMAGKAPQSIQVIRPIKDGVIADFSTTEAMLKHFIAKATSKRSLFRPRVAICIPSGVTELEKRAVEDSALSAGAREVFLVEEPVAAAIGAGLPIMEPSGNMIVDIGGGTTEVALISLGGIVIANSIRTAGDQMDEALVTHMKKKYSLLIGDTTAETIKMQYGEAFPSDVTDKVSLKGRDLIRGIPRTVQITRDEIRESLQEPIRNIIEAIRQTLEKTPPELASDIHDHGIVLTGGVAQLKNLDKLIHEETGLPVTLAENPLLSVVMGTGKILSDLETYQSVLIRRQF
ncbi:MAG: rod shape-determining protein [Bdellovibrionota bacterium]